MAARQAATKSTCKRKGVGYKLFWCRRILMHGALRGSWDVRNSACVFGYWSNKSLPQSNASVGVRYCVYAYRSQVAFSKRLATWSRMRIQRHWFFVMDWVGESRPTGNTRIRRLWYEFSGNEQAKVNQRGGKGWMKPDSNGWFLTAVQAETQQPQLAVNVWRWGNKSHLKKRPTGARPAIFSNLKERGSRSSTHNFLVVTTTDDYSLLHIYSNWHLIRPLCTANLNTEIE